MATTRTANTHWEGPLLAGGKGVVTLASSGLGAFDVDWPARSEEPGAKTSPEELIAAAHSACYSMALSNGLAKAGHDDITLETSAAVSFQPGQGITGVHLTVRARVPGLSEAEFADFAQTAKSGCPVSQALAGTTITLDAALAD